MQVVVSDGLLSDFQSITINVTNIPDTPPHWIATSDIGTHPAGYVPVSSSNFNHDATNDVLWFNPANLDLDLWKISNGRWAGRFRPMSSSAYNSALTPPPSARRSIFSCARGC